MNDSLVPRRALHLLVAIGLLTMFAVLIRALNYGYGWTQFTAIASIPWGQVLVADLYVGLMLFGAWIGWREGAGMVAGGWILALLLLGNVASCLYLVRALIQSRGDGRRFWLGTRLDRRDNRPASTAGL